MCILTKMYGFLIYIFMCGAVVNWMLLFCLVAQGVQHFATPWTAVCQAILSITNSQSSLKLTCIKVVMPSNNRILCCPFPCLQSFPGLGSFLMSQFFTSGGQSIRVSASVLSLNIQDWYPLGWTDWIFLQSKGLSRVFSNTTVQKHQFLSVQLSL